MFFFLTEPELTETFFQTVINKIYLLHPFFVHFPIASVLVLLAFDIFYLFGDPHYFRFGQIMLKLTLLFMVFALISGLFAGEEFFSPSVTIHKYFAFGMFFYVIFYLLYRKLPKGRPEKRPAFVYVILTTILFILTLTTGELGAKITHSETFLDVLYEYYNSPS